MKVKKFPFAGWKRKKWGERLELITDICHMLQPSIILQDRGVPNGCNQLFQRPAGQLARPDTPPRYSTLKTHKHCLPCPSTLIPPQQFQISYVPYQPCTARALPRDPTLSWIVRIPGFSLVPSYESIKTLWLSHRHSYSHRIVYSSTHSHITLAWKRRNAKYWYRWPIDWCFSVGTLGCHLAKLCLCDGPRSTHLRLSTYSGWRGPSDLLLFFSCLTARS